MRARKTNWVGGFQPSVCKMKVSSCWVLQRTWSEGKGFVSAWRLKTRCNGGASSIGWRWDSILPSTLSLGRRDEREWNRGAWFSWDFHMRKGKKGERVSRVSLASSQLGCYYNENNHPLIWSHVTYFTRSTIDKAQTITSFNPFQNRFSLSKPILYPLANSLADAHLLADTLSLVDIDADSFNTKRDVSSPNLKSSNKP